MGVLSWLLSLPPFLFRKSRKAFYWNGHWQSLSALETRAPGAGTKAPGAGTKQSAPISGAQVPVQRGARSSVLSKPPLLSAVGAGPSQGSWLLSGAESTGGWGPGAGVREVNEGNPRVSNARPRGVRECSGTNGCCGGPDCKSPSCGCYWQPSLCLARSPAAPGRKVARGSRCGASATPARQPTRLSLPPAPCGPFGLWPQLWGTKGWRALRLGVSLPRKRQITGALCECNMAARARSLGSFSPPGRRGRRRPCRAPTGSFPGGQSVLLAPPTPSPAEQRAAVRADSPRVHPSALCSPLGRHLTLRGLLMETLEDLATLGWTPGFLALYGFI